MKTRVSAKAHFLEPINHDDALTSFTGVATGWLVEAIMFNTGACEYDECEEADGSYVMHDIAFTDGTGYYFEVLSDGTLSHFHCSAFLEFRDGILVVSPGSVYQERRKRDAAIRPGKHSKRKINFGDIPF